jgi:hypothetical protein
MTLERPMFPPPHNIVTFPGPSPKRGRTSVVISEDEDEAPARRSNGSNMHTFLFRSYHLILESDEADLVRDVSLDIDKAQTKLKAIRRRLKGVLEQAAAQGAMLTAAETKLTAAIVAALLSTRGQE